MKAIIYEKKGSGMKEITRIPVPEEKNGNSFFSMMDGDVGNTCLEAAGISGRIADLGIRKLYTNGSVTSSLGPDKECSEEREVRCIKLGAASPVESEWQGEAAAYRADGSGEKEKTGKFFGLKFYREGYAVSTGKKSEPLFGSPADMYLDKITTRQFQSAGISSCRLFKDKKAVLKYLRSGRNEQVFRFMVKKYGYCFHVIPANGYFSEDEEAAASRMTERKKTAAKAAEEELDALLESINVEEGNVGGEPEIPEGPVTEDEMMAEAAYRMKTLGIDKMCGRAFKNGKLFQSEFRGILYDLDAEAEKAVEDARQFGIPYHVIVTDFKFGRVYAVLYVSRETEEWPIERYNPKDGMTTADCWMTDVQGSEIGTIIVKPANGGLVRKG